MRLTPLQRDQPALRANIYRNKPSVMLGEELRKQVESHIVRTDAEDRLFDLVTRSIHANSNLFTGLETLYTPWDERKSICLNKRSDDPGATREWCGEKFISQPANRNSYIIVITCRRNDLARQGCCFSGKFIGS